MRLLWKSALDPLFLFFAALTVGTIFILGPLARNAPRITVHHIHVQPVIGQTVIPVPLTASQPPKLDTSTFIAELQALQATSRERQIGVEATADEADAAQHRVDAARTDLAALDAKRASLRPVLATSTQPDEADHLHALIAQRRQEADRLQSDLERVTAPAPEPGTKAPVLALAKEPLHKLPQPVELIENRIAPVTKEYFHFPIVMFKPVFTVKRIRMGETIAGARQPDSGFAEFLSTIHPDRLYISCLLNRDSFEAYYAVREMAVKKGIDVGWEPADTSSGVIPMLGVKLASPSDKRRVRVPDVISPHQDHP